MKNILLMLLCLAALAASAQKPDTLKKDSVLLKTVTIRGQRPVIERRADGIVFTVGSQPAGADAADVLRKVPMVSVDGNGNLQVRGNGNVKVLTDGKPSEIYASSLADALRTIRGAQIAKVEVITDPSAKYEAEGTDAVINIITKKLRQNGTSGDIGGLLGNRAENVLGDLHHQHGPWQFHADAFKQLNHGQNGSVLVRQAGNQQLSQATETRQTGDYFAGGLSLIYCLDSLNTFFTGYRLRPQHSQLHTDVTSTFERNIDTKVGANGHTYNAGFNGQSRDKNCTVALLIVYVPQQTNTDYTLLENNGYHEKFAGTAPPKDLVLQGDYAHNFKSWKWESGVKFNRKQINNDSQYDPDAGRSAVFEYHQIIAAAYTNLSGHTGNWSWSTELRCEKTDVNAVNIKQSFVNWVPQFLLQRNLNAVASLKFSYAQKLVRPAISYLDPTLITSDSLTVQHGNPNLLPELTRRYQLTYAVNGAKLYQDFTLSYNDNRNSIENIRTTLPNGRLESTWANIGQNRRWGLSYTVNWKPAPVFQLGGTLTGQYVKLAGGGLQNQGFLRQLTVNLSYRLPVGFSLDSYGYFAANGLSLQGYSQGWKFYNVTLNKKFQGDRLNLSLRSEVPFSRYTYIDEVITTASGVQRQTSRYQNQSIRLTFIYKFGKTEVKTPTLPSRD